jgi:hypothetical protein
MTVKSVALTPVPSGVVTADLAGRGAQRHERDDRGVVDHREDRGALAVELAPGRAAEAAADDRHGASRRSPPTARTSR